MPEKLCGGEDDRQGENDGCNRIRMCRAVLWHLRGGKDRQRCENDNQERATEKAHVEGLTERRWHAILLVFATRGWRPDHPKPAAGAAPFNGLLCPAIKYCRGSNA